MEHAARLISDKLREEPMAKDQKDYVVGDFGAARVVAIPVNPEQENDVLVQRRDGSDWITVGSYNSLSNDYAYTSAREDAARLARRLEGR